jgi:AraC-like DNA-binding protein
LSQALIEKIARWGNVKIHLSGPQERLLGVLLDELLASQAEPMFLPMPRHKGMRKMAICLVDNPGDRRSIAEWAIYAGISERGLTRHFRAETGMTLVAWRTVARMKRALELLSDGVSVTATALELGYDSVSSFVIAFRQKVGVTPARYHGRLS